MAEGARKKQEVPCRSMVLEAAGRDSGSIRVQAATNSTGTCRDGERTDRFWNKYDQESNTAYTSRGFVSAPHLKRERLPGQSRLSSTFLKGCRA